MEIYVGWFVKLINLKIMIWLVVFDLDGMIGDIILLCLVVFREVIIFYVDYELLDDEIVWIFGLNEEGMIN